MSTSEAAAGPKTVIARILHEEAQMQELVG
jgi:hypothetical protein